jgi:hypothetical protein
VLKCVLCVCKQLVFLQCRSDDKTAALLYLLHTILKKGEQTVVFAATKHHVEFLNLVNLKVVQALAFNMCILLTSFFVCVIMMSANRVIDGYAKYDVPH